MNFVFKIFLTLSLFLNLYDTLHAQGYICAVGGGSENYNDWSDAPYSWIVQKADSGKIIILGVSSATAWLPTYFMSFGADTAYNKTISSISTANLQSTYDELITARAIFIRGGDQWDYISLWKGTKTDSAIQYVFNNGGVIAGTSAGAAVLGDVDFSAQSGSAYSDEALLNPFYSRMKFENNFLNFVPNVLFDTHFIERARHGRLIAMLYNQHFSTGVDFIGVGIDDRTAIAITPDGIGEVMGSGAVSVFYKDEVTNYSSFISGKYTIENLRTELLTKGWKYNFQNKEISFIPSSAKDVDTSRVYEYPMTDLVLTGSNNISNQLSINLFPFLSTVNNQNILIVSHSGFSGTIILLTDYLNANSYTYSVLNLSTDILNNSVEAKKINNATCFIFAGDSLDVLSYLNQTGTLLSNSFTASINSGKPVFFFGSSGKIAGEKFIGNTDTDIYASYRGKMTINIGLYIFGELIFQPLIYDNSDLYENRMSSVLFGMMRERKRMGIYLNGNDRINISASEKSINGNVSIPYLIVDARGTTKVDSSTYRASGSIGPRQVVAMNNLRLSFTTYSQINYSIEQGRFDNLTQIEEDNINSSPTRFLLYQNYPNPFNPGTKIRYSIPTLALLPPLHKEEIDVRFVTLKVYDVLGTEILTLINEQKLPGTYEVIFDGSKLPSGIYFYRLQVDNHIQTKKMLMIK